MDDNNTIYIGKKPTMNYVLATVTLFNSDTNDVLIKARGKSISKAVDVAEIVKNRFINDVEVNDIHISTETLTNNEGRTSNVSSIEIFLKKGEIPAAAAPEPTAELETPAPVETAPEEPTPEPEPETPAPVEAAPEEPTPEPEPETPAPVETTPEPEQDQT